MSMSLSLEELTMADNKLNNYTLIEILHLSYLLRDSLEYCHPQINVTEENFERRKMMAKQMLAEGNFIHKWLSNHPNEEVTIDNVKDYIELPRIIYEKAHLGNISWANFSDIVRNTLLAKYGGLWIDATVWVKGEIPLNNLSKLDFFSANGAVPATSRSVRFWTSFEHNWSTWCMWSRNKNNKLFSFVSEMMISIAEREKQWPDYVIQDYLIYYAYKNIPGIEEMLAQSVAIPCRNRNKLAEMMNDKFDEKRYKELIENDFVFKLSYRAKWKEQTIDNQQTFYGKILDFK